ncbi:hypothetical protein JHK87_018942 [Glycine soja]|nr:hypothetical protein JHK87_018942 [Glycine soja]
MEEDRVVTARQQRSEREQEEKKEKKETATIKWFLIGVIVRILASVSIVVAGVKIVVVFDAMMSGLPTHKEDITGLDIIFSSETCADTWIEKEVAALKEDGCPKVWVVTSNQCHQQAAHGVVGESIVAPTLVAVAEVAASRPKKCSTLKEKCFPSPITFLEYMWVDEEVGTYFSQ